MDAADAVRPALLQSSREGRIVKMSMLALLSSVLLGAGAVRADEIQFTSYQQIGATLHQQ